CLAVQRPTVEPVLKFIVAAIQDGSSVGVQRLVPDELLTSFRITVGVRVVGGLERACNPRWSPRNRVVRRDDGTRTIRDDTTGRIEVSVEITDGDVGGLSLLEVDVVRKVRPDAILVPVRNGVPTRDRPVGFSDTQTQRVDTSTPNSHLVGLVDQTAVRIVEPDVVSDLERTVDVVVVRGNGEGTVRRHHITKRNLCTLIRILL